MTILGWRSSAEASASRRNLPWSAEAWSSDWCGTFMATGRCSFESNAAKTLPKPPRPRNFAALETLRRTLLEGVAAARGGCRRCAVGRRRACRRGTGWLAAGFAGCVLRRLASVHRRGASLIGGILGPGQKTNSPLLFYPVLFYPATTSGRGNEGSRPSGRLVLFSDRA